MKHRNEVLREFSVALDKGEDATLRPVIADALVQQVMLLNGTLKAPARAQALNIHPRTFNRYQTGESAPTLYRAVRLLDLLGFEVIVRRKR